MVERKVRLTGHAAGDPPVIRTPSGHSVLERISTSFSYKRIVSSFTDSGH